MIENFATLIKEVTVLEKLSKGSSENLVDVNDLNKPLNSGPLKVKGDEILSEQQEKQGNLIEDVKSGKIVLETTQEKGNFGEIIMDNHFESKDLNRISIDRVKSLNESGHIGIDGVYESGNPPPKFIIAEAKYGTSQLSDTLDGKQMSDYWIDKRLDGAVGKEKADEIRMEELKKPENVKHLLIRIDEKSNVQEYNIDKNGDIER